MVNNMILVVDTETTGLDPVKGDCVVELAAVPLSSEGDLGPLASTLVAAGRRIPPPAKAVHHIREEELRDAPHLAGIAEAYLRAFPVAAYAAHNAPFDRGFLDPHVIPGVPWIDTWRCALHLVPDAPSHSNQALRYYLPEVDRFVSPRLPGGLGAHRAGYDVVVTAGLLKYLLGREPLEKLIRLSTEPVLLRTVRFGKYFGETWATAGRDRGYLQWLLRQEFDEDTKHTARYYLNGRSSTRASCS